MGVIMAAGSSDPSAAHSVSFARVYLIFAGWKGAAGIKLPDRARCVTTRQLIHLSADGSISFTKELHGHIIRWLTKIGSGS